jgi:dTDP-4-amino-4,6-dideoxygalactose transaminase
MYDGMTWPSTMVSAVLASGKLTDASFEGGKMVRELEGKLKRLLGSKQVVAVNSGTAALHCTMLALGIKKGDEVVLPAFTFVSTANVVLACGGRPVFVDNKDDYNIDPAAVAKAITRKTKAIMPVHVYGYPADMDEITEIAEKRAIPVVEDAAESLGAEYKGRQTGTLSKAGCFSLYATKVVTSGEGGAISTDDEKFAERLRLVRNHGMLHGYDSRHLGFNYRLTETAAAIGSVQMDRLKGFVTRRRRNARYLNERISWLSGVEFTQNEHDRTHVFYLYTLTVRKKRDEILRRLNEKGIGAAVYWRTPVNRNPLYAELGYGKPKLRNAEYDSRHVISLPVQPAVGREEIERVADEFVDAFSSVR